MHLSLRITSHFEKSYYKQIFVQSQIHKQNCLSSAARLQTVAKLVNGPPMRPLSLQPAGFILIERQRTNSYRRLLLGEWEFWFGFGDVKTVNWPSLFITWNKTEENMELPTHECDGTNQVAFNFVLSDSLGIIIKKQKFQIVF